MGHLPIFFCDRAVWWLCQWSIRKRNRSNRPVPNQNKRSKARTLSIAYLLGFTALRSTPQQICTQFLLCCAYTTLFICSRTDWYGGLLQQLRSWGMDQCPSKLLRSWCTHNGKVKRPSRLPYCLLNNAYCQHIHFNALTNDNDVTETDLSYRFYKY